jgi:hypothetical protein
MKASLPLLPSIPASRLARPQDGRLRACPPRSTRYRSPTSPRPRRRSSSMAATAWWLPTPPPTGRMVSSCRRSGYPTENEDGLLRRSGSYRSGRRTLCNFLQPLLSESAPRTLNVRSHTGGLFSQACDRWPIEMRLECCIVLINLVEEQFPILVVRDQDFELQGPRLVFQAARFVRHEQVRRIRSI